MNNNDFWLAQEDMKKTNSPITDEVEEEFDQDAYDEYLYEQYEDRKLMEEEREE